MLERLFTFHKGTVAFSLTQSPTSFIQTLSTCFIVSRNDSAVGWCISVLGLSVSNQIIGQNWNGVEVSVTGPVLPLNTWTHLVTSYSPSTGLSLWVNGTRVASPVPLRIAAPDAPLFLTLGTRVPSSWRCANGSIQGGQFYGMMDELRVYSRELNASEICSLACPRR